MNQLFTKLKDPFIKEVLLAIVLFCLPFLIFLHKLVSEEKVTQIQIFGMTYDHRFYNDAGFLWTILVFLIPIICARLFFFKGSSNIKYFVFVLFYFVIGDFFFLILSGFQQYVSNIWAWIVSYALTTLYFHIVVRPDFPNIRLAKIIENGKPLRTSVYLVLMFSTIVFWFLWRILPEDEEVFFIGTVKFFAFGFPSISGLYYVLSLKMVLIIPMLLWFLTENKWWKYALLSPILITTYQLWTIFSPASDTMDEYEIFQALPLLGLLTIVLIALSKNAKDQYLFKAIYNSTYTKAEKTVKKRFKKKQLELDKAKEALESYKEKSNEASLEELKALKESLEKKLSR